MLGLRPSSVPVSQSQDSGVSQDDPVHALPPTSCRISNALVLGALMSHSLGGGVCILISSMMMGGDHVALEPC